MNRQGPHGIEWTNIFGPGTGYTWNPVAGCQHGCRWKMPGGKIAVCYAETTAERLAQTAYPRGFAHHYFHPHRLAEPRRLKTRAGIFIDSMSDLMGHWVSDEEIRRVIEVCATTPQHIYFLLTKNPRRLTSFDWPRNVWLGVSSPPDFMWGQPLTRWQQRRMVDVTLAAFEALPRDNIKWLSAEPLSSDAILEVCKSPAPLDWIVIGAASSGREYSPPYWRLLDLLLDYADARRIPVFFKGNLRCLPYAVDHWRAVWPAVRTS